MFEEDRVVKVYRVTVKKIIERLLSLKQIELENFNNEVLEQFDGYDYKDIEEVVGFETWPDMSANGDYELMVKVNHEDAYEFTLHVTVKEGKVTVLNVL